MKLSKKISNPSSATAIICIAINLLVIFWVFLSQSSLPPIVPLFYGLPSGEEQLAQSSLLIIPPIIAILLIIADYLLLKVTKDQFIQNVLLSTMAVITALSTITVAKIIFLIT